MLFNQLSSVSICSFWIDGDKDRKNPKTKDAVCKIIRNSGEGLGCGFFCSFAAKLFSKYT